MLYQRHVQRYPRTLLHVEDIASGTELPSFAFQTSFFIVHYRRIKQQFKDHGT